jgi:hypothetical protein
MLKALFWFVVGTAATVIFFAIMLFIFGQTDRVVCRHQGDGLASCSVSHVLLNVVPLPGWQADNVSQAHVERDCQSDGCTYRTALVTAAGDNRPISEVWTDQQAQDQRLASEINDFILDANAPTLVIDNAPAAWVIWLLAGLAAMTIVIQGIVLVAQFARSLFASRSSVGGTYR